ncbi:MAG: peptidylprolyl isomerase [Thermoanaerobaculia bacterium]|nr:peptidylprolyl isomerase [Thermoanaerobaculia bacterium]
MRLKASILASALLGTSVLVAGCHTKPLGETIIAHYHGGEVTESEYRSWLDLTGATDDPERRLAVTTAIALQETLAEAARERGAAELEPVQVALQAEALKELGRAFRSRVDKPSAPSDDEVASWLSEHGERLRRPRRVRLSNIFQRAEREGPARASTAARMAAIRAELLDGGDWGTIALRESDSQTRFRQGRIGLVKQGMLETGIEEVAFRLESGEISQVIETAKGFTLLRCDGIESAIEPSALEEREAAVQALGQERLKAQARELENELLASVRFDAAAAQLASTPGNHIVAAVEDRWSLSLSDANSLLQLRGVRQHLADFQPEQVRTLLNGLAIEHQAAERARNLGLDRDPDVVATIRWRETIVLATEELKHQVQERFEPLLEEEIKARFDATQEHYRMPPSFRLAAISFRAEADNLLERYSLGERIEADIRGGQLSFSEAAARYSELPSAQRGGLLGWLTLEQVAALGPQVLAAVKGLALGSVGALVQQPDALPREGHTLWIVQLLDRREARQATFDEVHRQVENDLGNERTRILQAQIEQELTAQLDVTTLAR